jgi:hypothetical protein
MISQLKFLLNIFLSTTTVIVQSFPKEAVVNPDKNETDYIAQSHQCVKLPMGKYKNTGARRKAKDAGKKL